MTDPSNPLAASEEDLPPDVVDLDAVEEDPDPATLPPGSVVAVPLETVLSSVPPKAVETLPSKIDAETFKRVGNEILSSLRESVRGINLTEQEAAIAARAAQALTAATVLAIGADFDARRRLTIEAERAQATLLNLYVGEKVELRQKARDTIVNVLRIVFTEALGLIIGLPIIRR